MSQDEKGDPYLVALLEARIRRLGLLLRDFGGPFVRLKMIFWVAKTL
jgi:hypothetical protein